MAENEDDDDDDEEEEAAFRCPENDDAQTRHGEACERRLVSHCDEAAHRRHRRRRRRRRRAQARCLEAGERVLIFASLATHQARNFRFACRASYCA